MNSYWWWSSGAEANDSGVEIGQSLRFRGGSSVVLSSNRQFQATDGAFTLSFWVKFGAQQLNTSNTLSFLGKMFQFQGNCQLVFGYDRRNGGAIFDNNGGTDNSPVFRDPSAWYHFVVTDDGTGNSQNTYIVNGSVTWTPGSSGRSATDQTFSIGFTSGWGEFDGYMADVYFIDGQVLQPTAFGRENDNGVWVPREVDFTPATMRYSDFLTPTVPGTWDDGNATNVFDGLTTTFAGTGANGTWTFAPTTDIAVGTQVRVFALNTAGTISWNGQTATPNGGWVTLTASGDINATTPLVGTTVGAGQSSFVNAIEVDGEILTNPFLWSADVTNPDGWGTGASALSSWFDGSLTSAALCLGDGPVTFTPTGGITYTTSVRMMFNGAGTGDFRVNFNGGGEVAVPGTNDTMGTWYEVDTGSGTFNSVVITRPGSQVSLVAIEIDGQVLIDGVNNSYGANGFHLQFANPDDLGHDSSGNGNDFTANNFNTDLPGLWSNGLEQSAAGAYLAAGNAGRTSGVNGATNAFNGNLTNQAQGPGTGSWLYWTTSIACDTVQLIVNNDTDQLPASARINGTDVAIPAHTVDGSNFVVSFPVANGTLTEFAYANTGNGPNTSIFGMRVNNGAVLVDNTGADYDLMTGDSPTNNAATLNPVETPSLRSGNTRTYVNANLGVSQTFHGNSSYPSNTIAFNPATQSLYFEVTRDTNTQLALLFQDPSNIVAGADPAGSDMADTIAYNSSGQDGAISRAFRDATQVGGNLPLTMQDYLRVACSPLGVWFGNATQWIQNASGTLTAVDAFPATNPTVPALTDPPDRFVVAAVTETADASFINFGQQPFVNTPPAGFNRLQTQNLPAATIRNGRDHFGVLTYEGDNTAGRNVTGLSFTPGLVWVKNRDLSRDHVVSDNRMNSGRKVIPNTPNGNGAMTASDDFVRGFVDGGFTVGNNDQVNGDNTNDYVAWCWRSADANTNVTETDAIPSSCRINTAAGFSIIQFTGNTDTDRVGHGLDREPEFVISKCLGVGSTAWQIYHHDLGVGSFLPFTTSAMSNIANFWGTAANWNNNTCGLSTTGSDNNRNNELMRWYAWHGVEGFSRFGSFTGNGQTNGSFVHLGFKPALLVIRAAQTGTSGEEPWMVYDSAREPNNPVNEALEWNSRNAEGATARDVDLLSNGFKLRSAGNQVNGNTTNYIYAAWAEMPAGASNTSPANAR